MLQYPQVMSIVSVLLGWGELNGGSLTLFKVLAALGGLLLFWRLWRFTILPTFATAEPRELPYWIPCE